MSNMRQNQRDGRQLSYESMPDIGSIYLSPGGSLEYSVRHHNRSGTREETIPVESSTPPEVKLGEFFCNFLSIHHDFMWAQQHQGYFHVMTRYPRFLSLHPCDNQDFDSHCEEVQFLFHELLFTHLYRGRLQTTSALQRLYHVTVLRVWRVLREMFRYNTLLWSPLILHLPTFERDEFLGSCICLALSDTQLRVVKNTVSCAVRSRFTDENTREILQERLDETNDLSGFHDFDHHYGIERSAFHYILKALIGGTERSMGYLALLLGGLAWDDFRGLRDALLLLSQSWPEPTQFSRCREAFQHVCDTMDYASKFFEELEGHVRCYLLWMECNFGTNLAALASEYGIPARHAHYVAPDGTGWANAVFMWINQLYGLSKMMRNLRQFLRGEEIRENPGVLAAFLWGGVYVQEEDFSL